MGPLVIHLDMMAKKPKILCLTDYYLPGFKGGGPIRTLANMCEVLSNDVEFSIFTRDRDLGSDRPYPDVRRDEWVSFNSGRLFYAAPDMFSAKGLRASISGQSFDILYLNSFFSYRASISIYLDWRRHAGAANVLIAPRGEFSPGALAIKPLKKRAFLLLSRALGLYRDVHWHASTTEEATDILRQFPYAAGRIHIAADPVAIGGPTACENFPAKAEGDLKIAFISRISPKKNLDGLLQILQGVDRKVELSVFGPIEDAAYWRKCQALMETLPENIRVTHCGTLKPDEVPVAFAVHDVFAFPTHGENFGHVIFEALRAGTPALVSDRTPWKSSDCGALTAIPLHNVDEWRRRILEAADRRQEEQDTLRKAALEYARRYIAQDRTRLDMLAMFRAAARRQPERPPSYS